MTLRALNDGRTLHDEVEFSSLRVAASPQRPRADSLRPTQWRPPVDIAVAEEDQPTRRLDRLWAKLSNQPAGLGFDTLPMSWVTPVPVAEVGRSEAATLLGRAKQRLQRLDELDGGAGSPLGSRGAGSSAQSAQSSLLARARSIVERRLDF